MHHTYRDLYLTRAQLAIGAARACSGITHGGHKGEIREILIRDLLRPMLPLDVGVGSGEIISAFGETSPQQDILIYDRRIMPPLLFEERTGLFPIESVLFSIEIKSKLSAGELQKANEAAENLLKLRFYSGQYDATGKPLSHSLKRPLYALFAFDSDLSLSGKNELERYIEICDSTPTLTRIDGPPVRMICVVGRGCWVYQTPDWLFWRESYPLEEVLRFVSVIMNTYRTIAASRGEPRLGAYLLEEGTSQRRGIG